MELRHTSGRRTGSVHRVVLIAVCILGLLVVYAIYIFRAAALPTPRGADGKAVLPLPVPDQSTTPLPVRNRRHSAVSVESLERSDDRDVRVQNWDAVLTLAHLSSEVYSDTRIGFALDTLGFERAVAVDNGDRHSLVCSNSKVLVVAFRGTETLTDIFHDIGLVPIGINSTEGGCFAHAGFDLACNSVYGKAIEEIERQDGRNKQIIVTGHSLGGAMAVLFAYRAQTLNGLEIKSIVTFGQPLLANKNLADSLLRLFQGRHKRFVHRDDIVSRVARPYFHSGARILLAENEAPRFWKPEILVQATPGGIKKEEPDFMTDPDLASLSKDELNEVEAYFQQGVPSKVDDQRSLKKTRRSRRKDIDRPTSMAVGSAPNGGIVDWISRGLDDHKMGYYIDCIEMLEIDADE